MRVLVTKLQEVERVAFAPEGTHLFAAGTSADTGICAFDLAGGPEPVAELFAGRLICWFAPLPDGRLAAATEYYSHEDRRTSDPAVSVLDRGTGRDVRCPAGDWQVWALCAVSPDGRRLIARLAGPTLGDTGRGYRAHEQGVGCWELPPRGRPHLAWHVNLGRSREIHAVACAPDGRSFWTVERVAEPPPVYWRPELVPRAIEDGTPGPSVAGPAHNTTIDLELAPGGAFAVTHDGYGPSLLVHDLAKRDRKPKRLANPARRKPLRRFAIHPSGNWLAATGKDGAVILWDTATWKVTRSWAWNAGRPRSVCFSTDGTLAAAGTDTGRIVVWDLDT